MLHLVESNEERKQDTPAESNRDKRQERPSGPSTQTQHAQTGHCGAVGTGKKQVCLRVIPVRVFGTEDGLGEITYAIRDKGSNTTLIKESLVDKLRLKGHPVDFRLTTANKVSQESGKSRSLYVQGLGQKECLEIPNALSVSDLSVAESCIPSKDDISKWCHLDGISIPELENPEVTILIGTDVPEAHWKLEERRGRKKEPYAVRIPLGWSVAGPMGTALESNVNSFFIRHEDDFLNETVDKMFRMDFSESTHYQGTSMSLEDKSAQTIMEKSLKVIDGYYQLDLPFRKKLQFPNNRSLAEKRLKSLKKRLKKDQDLYEKYKDVINEYIEKGYASKIEENQPDEACTEKGCVWYLPHHPVLHSQKPQRPRIVFDCAARYKDVSLNGWLLQGPNMTNTRVGVLSRFRQGPIAFIADIEKMFCQVRVSPEHCDFLRFLWWRDSNYDQSPEDYQMLVHLFGATSSASCAGFCLRKAADEFEGEFDVTTIETIRRNFYVDDCLKSVTETEKGIRLIQELRQLLARRSFRLTKFVSNDRDVLSSIPESERALSLVTLDLDELPVERALGIQWNVQEDVFSFRIIHRKKAATRRGILSDVSSMYDPLGFAAPFILPAKRLLQHLCKDKIGWDEEIPSSMQEIWERWLNDLPRLQQITVPRYFKSHRLGQLKNTQLYHFSDTFSEGYGTASYLRFVDVNDQVHCSLIMWKSRVAPIKPTTIPRLELPAATVAVKQDRQIREELDVNIDSVTFWTDSTCVLQYINNEAGRFKTFVANRIAIIHANSNPSCWRYVDSKANPADFASRGLRSTDEFEIDQWINGPNFLRSGEEIWPTRPEGINVLSNETLEWKRNVEIYETQAQLYRPLDVFIQYYSSWYRLQKGVAWFIRFVDHLRTVHQVRNSKDRTSRSSDYPSHGEVTGAGVGPLSVGELRNAKKVLVRYVQRQSFPEEVASLKCMSSGISSSDAVVKKSSRLAALSPFKDDDGLLRVGGRLEKADISFDPKHPMVIPSKHHLVDPL